MAKISYVIGIDSGGTKIRGVLMQKNKIIKRAEALHESYLPSAKQFLKTLFSVIDQLYTAKVKTIGVGIPGVISKNQKIIGEGMVKQLAKINDGKIVAKKYGVKVVLGNDVKTALLAETQKNKEYKSIFMLTLGTGIGAGWFLNSQIMAGSFDSAYELGQMVIDKQTNRVIEKESCGAEFFRSRGYDPIASEDRARAGNVFHKKLWEEFGVNLGIVLANVINLIEPEQIIIGGGLIHAWDLFMPSTKKSIKQYVLSPLARSKTKISKAKLGKWSGALGAAMLAKQPAQ
jgi:glucokinase